MAIKPPHPNRKIGKPKPICYVSISLISKLAVPVPVSLPVAVKKLPTVPKLGEPDVTTLYSTPVIKSAALYTFLFKNTEFSPIPANFAFAFEL